MTGAAPFMDGAGVTGFIVRRHRERRVECVEYSAHGESVAG
jgi:hypothetical protein